MQDQNNEAAIAKARQAAEAEAQARVVALIQWIQMGGDPAKFDEQWQLARGPLTPEETEQAALVEAAKAAEAEAQERVSSLINWVQNGGTRADFDQQWEAYRAQRAAEAAIQHDMA